MSFRPLVPGITSRIPSEVYERILDYLHDSSETLLTCSVVCRSWLPTCRYHLFREVRLTPAFVNFILASQEATASILPLIRRLTLGGVWFRQEQDELTGIIEFLIHLESTTELVLETWSWSYLTASAEQMLLSAQGELFDKITSIEMTYVRFPSLTTLKCFLNCFPSLKKLSLDNVTWDVESPMLVPSSHRGETSPQFICSLEHLRINASPVDALLGWMFPVAGPISSLRNDDELVIFPRLLSLSVPEVLKHEAPLIQHVLCMLGQSIQALEIGFLLYDSGPEAKPDGILDHLDLSHNINLEHLHIANLTLYRMRYHPVDAERDVTHFDPCFHWVSSLVGSVNSSSFASLTVGLWLTSESDLDMLQWQSMGSLLAKDHLAEDFVMRFLICGIAEGGTDVSGWIQKRLVGLPDLQAKQIELDFAY